MMRESIYTRAYSRAIDDGHNDDEARDIAQRALLDSDDESGVFDLVVPDGEMAAWNADALIAGE